MNSNYNYKPINKAGYYRVVEQRNNHHYKIHYINFQAQLQNAQSDKIKSSFSKKKQINLQGIVQNKQPKKMFWCQIFVQESYFKVKKFKSLFILVKNSIYNKINISAMSAQDNSLLTFLKKQSLFSNSPPKNMARRMSSRSRQKQNQQMRQNNHFNNQTSTSPARKLTFGDQYNMQTSSIDINNRASYHNSYQNNNYNKNTYVAYDGPNYTNGNMTNYNVVNYSSSMNQVTRGNPEQRSDRESKISTEPNYSSSFESARSETALRLQDLASKVRTEINALNMKIDMFGQQMSQFISVQNTQVKEKIYRIVQDALKDSQRYIFQYMRNQQAKFTEEFTRFRASLQTQIQNIEAMRRDISKPYWVNRAGVFITSEFEKRVESVLAQCQIVRYKSIDQSMIGYQFGDMQKYLFDTVKDRIKKERERMYGV